MKEYSSVKEMMLDVGLGQTIDPFLNKLVERVVQTKYGFQFTILETYVDVVEIAEAHAIVNVSGTLPVAEQRRVVAHVESVVVHYDLVSKILEAAKRNNFLNVPDDYVSRDSLDTLGFGQFIGLEIPRVGQYGICYEEEPIDETRSKLVFNMNQRSSLFNTMSNEAWKDWLDIPYNLVYDFYAKEFDR